MRLVTIMLAPAAVVATVTLLMVDRADAGTRLRIAHLGRLAPLHPRRPNRRIQPSYRNPS